MVNRLAGEHSMYLWQHKDNPVDWWPWGAEAFAEAHRRDAPVLLSVGYASCHWCHVMAHESFEDDATATLINAHFVAIKVDREERPDIDSIYMAATQALTGAGGWPMTVFLTPNGEPFYAGTYFPPAPQSGMPSFSQLLTAVSRTWSEQREEVVGAAGRITSALREQLKDLSGAEIGGDDLDTARDALIAESDTVNGGFGGAPKFPPSMALEFLLRNYERTGAIDALQAVTLTLGKMARGGIYDQLGGGFARYSVDSSWHVPHFEKMLDDNALLLRVYAHHARLTGATLSMRIADEVGEFLLRDMCSDNGGFITSLDADTAGVEGGTYRWSIAEIRDIVGADDAARALELFGIDPVRPDPDGEVLRLVRGPDRDTDTEHVSNHVTDQHRGEDAWFADVRARLLTARNRRAQPGRDEIVVLGSNGLVITALAEAGAALGKPQWIEAARDAAEAIARTHHAPHGWRRSCLNGTPGTGQATLADVASFAAAQLALYQATGETARLTMAMDILDHTLADFRADDGGWFDTPAAGTHSSGDGPAITRPRDPTDGVAPSGAAAVADALVTAAALTGRSDLRLAAEQTLASVSALIVHYPRSAGWHLAVAEAVEAGPLQVAIAGQAGPELDALAAAARTDAPGGSVIDCGTPDAPNRPLLADRPGIGGRPAAYVCRGFVCDRPVDDPAGLRAMLRREAP